MNKLDNLVHPYTGVRLTASTGTSWLWVFLFGPFAHLFSGRITTFFLSLFLLCITFGLSSLYYIIKARDVNRNYYLDRGFVPYSDLLNEKESKERHDHVMNVLAVKS